MFERMLVAIDDSASTPYTLSYATAVAHAHDAIVHVVYVNEFHRRAGLDGPHCDRGRGAGAKRGRPAPGRWGGRDGVGDPVHLFQRGQRDRRRSRPPGQRSYPCRFSPSSGCVAAMGEEYTRTNNVRYPSSRAGRSGSVAAPRRASAGAG